MAEVGRWVIRAVLGAQLLGCAHEMERAGPTATGGEAGEETGGSGGAPGGSGGATGGSRGVTGGTGGATGGSGTGGQRADAAVATDTGASPDLAAPVESDASLPPSPLRDGGGASGLGQGPVAEGTIAYSQDFENGMAGITRSPTNLPADRAEIADDPLGQRGKVLKIVWKAGDNFMTIGGSTHTRSFISNTGYSFPLGSTVHYAWGYMTTSVQIDAAFAQHIRSGGPMWLIEGNGDGSTYVNCRSCGGKAALPVKLEPNRWYDFRVEMAYRNGGPIVFYVDGVKVLERQMTITDAAGTRAHWDGGIYNHAAGTYTRTVYISNLSIGTK